MKPLLLLAAASLIPLASCASGDRAPRATLECPATQGKLTRASAASDGKTCTYVSADGAEVVLRLVPVSGGPYATLDRLEASLVAEAGAATDAATGAATGTAVATAATAPSPQSAADARRAADEAAKDAASLDVFENSPADDGVDVRMKDGKVVVTEGGEKTRIDLPGINIEADEADDSASVRIGPMHIDANSDGATMKIRRDVRLKGEALSREKRGIRATYIAGDRMGANRSFAGYEAGGPKVGPLAVAVIRADGDLNDSDDLLDDVKRLVRKNGGV